MAEKRTKADKALRQSDRADRRTEARPPQTPKKLKPQAADASFHRLGEMNFSLIG